MQVKSVQGAGVPKVDESVPLPDLPRFLAAQLAAAAAGTAPPTASGVPGLATAGSSFAVISPALLAAAGSGGWGGPGGGGPGAGGLTDREDMRGGLSDHHHHHHHHHHREREYRDHRERDRERERERGDRDRDRR